MKEKILIPCNRCGTLRTWIGYECISGCPCLNGEPQEEELDEEGELAIN